MNTLGKDGEAAAARFLEKRGYRILERNFRTPFGEIDIIAREGDSVVFVEVKTRADRSFGHPFEAVNPRKREKIRQVALCYLKKKIRKEVPARFDVLSISVEGGEQKISHIRDAFEV